MNPFVYASKEQNQFFLEELNKSRIQTLSLLVRTTFSGKPDPKAVEKRRAKNKLARKQRRINRLRSKH